MKTRKLKAADLFCGAGGFTTGAEQVRQVGNAVCPPVAKALCETIAEAA